MAGDNDDNHQRDNMAGDNNDRDPSDNDCNPNESNSPDAPLQKRRVVDVTVDDLDWEDEVEGTLPGLGTTTHRSHNPHCKMQHRVVAGLNMRATVARQQKESLKCLDALAADLDAWEVECEECVCKLMEKHGMKPKEVCCCMLSLSTYDARCRPSTYNAKISCIMADLNECE
jgi:hypothetical protein